MKKRIISLLLAVITVMQIVPWTMLPIIAEGDENADAITVEDMEVGKLYTAEFISDEFWPYARFPFESTYDTHGVVISMDEVPETISIIRKSADDFDLVYIADDSSEWLGTYSEYRYIEAYRFVIDSGISVDEMEIGKAYSATWNTSDTGVAPYRKTDGKGAEFYEYGLFDDKEPNVSTDGFPDKLTVKLVYADDAFVYVTNEDWPEAFDQYRYLDPEYDIIITGEYNEPADEYIHGKVDIFCDEAEGGVVTLQTGGKVYAFTKFDSEISKESAKYRWQIKLEDGRWATIGDYIYPYAVLSEALLVNNPSSTGRATLRCIVTDGSKKYASDEIALQMAIKDNATEQLSSMNVDSYNAIAPMQKLAADDPSALSVDAFQIVINYTFRHETSAELTEIDGTPAANTFTVTLPTGGEYTGTVASPPVVGYLPYVLEEHKDYITGGAATTKEYGGKTYYLANSINFEKVKSETQINVFYIPQEVNFMVKIYEQNLHNDEYVLAATEILRGISDSAVGEGHDKARAGFSPLYYDPEIAINGDGTTVIDIYYDRNYYLINFDLASDEAYGATPYYVRYDSQVMLPTPTRPGYSFTQWTLNEVYNVLEDKSKQVVTDANIIALYNQKDAGKLITVQHNAKYTAGWNSATTSYTIIYWLENANDDGFTLNSFEVVDGVTPGTTVSGSDRYNKSDKSYFTYNATLSDKNVVVKGDGTTAVNVYYLRKYYTLTFTGSGSTCIRQEHTHNADCPTGTCSLEPHSHTDECGIASQTCGKEEHIHSDACCSMPEHVHSDSCCNITVHTHSVTCCTVTEHTHINTCYADSYRFTAISRLTNDPKDAYNNLIANVSDRVNGYVYRARSNSTNNTNYNFFYVNGTWYYLGTNNTYYVTVGTISTPSYNNPTYGPATVSSSRCDNEEHTHGDGKCTCAQLAHDHTVGCSCAITAHTHGDGICEYTLCGKEKHTHTTACYTYSCGKTAHTHGGDCVRACQIPEHTHATACNNTNSKNFQIITAKYGADIGHFWREIWEFFPNGERWDPSNFYEEVLVYLPFMPPADITFRKDSNFSGKDTFVIHYYLQSLGTSGTLYQGNYYDLNNTVTAKYGYLSRAEDFFDITGFTQYTSNPAFSNNQINNGGGNVYLYYTRNVYELQFVSNGIPLTALNKTLMYQQPIGTAYEPNEVPYPVNIETGAVKFAGWYTTPTCADGTEFFFDGNTEMPLNGLTLYAKWEDCSYTANIYLDSEKDTLLENGSQTVLFGSQIVEPDYKAAQASNPAYEKLIFAGWYYMDGSEEKRFDFNTMVLKQDLDIYAKWTSKVPVEYTVYYVATVNGEKVEIADRTVGQSLAGISKSFTAKVGSELYDNYDTGYFPQKRSSSILMSNTEANEYEFVYSVPAEIHYTVTHEFVSDDFVKILGTNKLSKEFDHKISGTDIKTTAASVTASFREGVTKDAIVKAAEDQTHKTFTEDQKTALWNIVVNLSPNNFEQVIILSTDDVNNATFNWVSRGSVSTYQVIHYFKTLSGEYVAEMTNEFVGDIGKTVYVEGVDPGTAKDPIEIKAVTRYGFKLNTQAQGSVLKGEIKKLTVGNGGELTGALILKLYYDRETYDYTVHHYKLGTTDELAPSDTVKGVPFETVVSVDSLKKNIDGYTLENGATSIEIVDNGQEIICYYKGLDVQYRYQVIGSTGGSLTEYIGDTVVGSAPKETTLSINGDGFFLNRWYYTVSGDGQQITVPDEWLSDDKMTLTPSAPGAEWANKTITVYAEILPTTRTFVNVGLPENSTQAVVYRLKGKDGTATAGVDVTFTIIGKGSAVIAMLPYGEYTVTVLDWSWRYEDPSVTFNGKTFVSTTGSFDLTLDAVGDVTFTFSSSSNNQWLTDDAIGIISPIQNS